MTYTYFISELFTTFFFCYALSVFIGGIFSIFPNVEDDFKLKVFRY